MATIIKLSKSISIILLLLLLLLLFFLIYVSVWASLRVPRLISRPTEHPANPVGM